MNEQYAAMITELPLFKDYTVHGAQRLLDSGEIKDREPGELLFKAGEPATNVLLVLAGRLEVFVERESEHFVISQVGPGTILGELAVLCGIDRSASVRVMEPSKVLEWEGSVFRHLLFSDAFLSERIFRQSLRTVIEKERSLIASITESHRAERQKADSQK